MEKNSTQYNKSLWKLKLIYSIFFIDIVSAMLKYLLQIEINYIIFGEFAQQQQRKKTLKFI